MILVFGIGVGLNFKTTAALARELVADSEFVEIHVDTPLEICKQRDPKGLYVRALEGKIKNFTGIDSPYEPPENAEIIVDTSKGTAEEVAAHIIATLREKQIIS